MTVTHSTPLPGETLAPSTVGTPVQKKKTDRETRQTNTMKTTFYFFILIKYVVYSYAAMLNMIMQKRFN